MRHDGRKVVVVKVVEMKDPPLPLPFFDEKGRKLRWQVLSGNASHAGGKR